MQAIRSLFASLTVFSLLAITIPAPACGSDAAQFVQNLGNDAVTILNSSGLPKPQQIERLRGIFVSYFDVPEISKFVAGRYWRRLSDAQRGEYLQLFEDYIVYVYAGRLGSYGGESLTVKGSLPKTETPGATKVMSEIVSPRTGKSYKVDWEVEGEDANYKITDIVVEGVSMRQQQRRDFGALIQQSGGNFEGLLQALRKKNSQLKAESEQAS